MLQKLGHQRLRWMTMWRFRGPEFHSPVLNERAKHGETREGMEGITVQCTVQPLKQCVAKSCAEVCACVCVCLCLFV